MTTIRTFAPNVMAVTLAQAKESLRIDSDDMDSLITLWAKGVIAEAEAQTGQCLMRQTWEVRLDAFPGIDCHRMGEPCSSLLPTAIQLPHPVIEITSIQYLDPSGLVQTCAQNSYRIKRDRYSSSVAPVSGSSWPATLDETGAVTVTVVCGYGDDPTKTPEQFQLYILAKLAEQFDPATRAERETVQSKYLDGLLDACRCYV